MKYPFLKLTIAIIYALSIFFVFSIDFTAVGMAGFQRKLLFAEAQQRHPDVWNNCDQKCIDARVQSAPFLPGLAKQAGVDLNDLVKYAVVRSYEWGQNFENLYGHPPTEHDWVYGYADNAEQLRYELDTSPNIFIINNWQDKQYRYHGEYE